MTTKEAQDAIKKEILNELDFYDIKYKKYDNEYRRAIVEKK